MNPQLSDESRNTLARVAEAYRLSLIYVFGSQAQLGLKLLSGDTAPAVDPLADIDVGVVFKDGLPPLEARSDVYAGLYGELADLFAPHRLDLCFLEENHSVFQCSVFQGACIYAASDEARLDYEEMIVRRAADFRPVLETYLDEILEEM